MITWLKHRLNSLFSVFENTVSPYHPLPGHTPPKDFLAYCWFYIRPMRWTVAIMIFTTLALAISEAMVLNFFGQLVDWLSAAQPNRFYATHKTTLWWYSGFLLIWLPALQLTNNLISFQAIMGNMPMIARWNMHRYMLNQSVGFFAKEFAGRVSTKVLQTSISIRDMLMKSAGTIVFVGSTLLSLVVLIGLADFYLLAPFALWLIIHTCIMWSFWPKLIAKSKQQADQRARMTGRIVDAYTNIITFKLFSNTRHETQYAKESMEGFMKSVHAQMRTLTLYDMCINGNNCVLLFNTAAVSIGLWRVSRVSLGDITLCAAACIRLQSLSAWFMWEIGNIFENMGIIYDGISSMSQPLLVKDSEEAKNFKPTQPHKGLALRFDQVCFYYHDQQPLLNQFSLHIKAGEKVGLIGRSGAGKSTLMNLLLRFYNIQSGTITIDGQPLANLKQESLRQYIAVVGQEGMLLHRSIRENIAYGQNHASDQAIVQAAKKAGAWSFIETLVDSHGKRGLDALVGERGVMLSGGQRQRIAIARVILKDAPLVILDEATSALDSEIEKIIQEQLDQIMAHKTVVAIAHRLSTIAHMDRLVVLDQGTIVETGTHTELLAKKGLYHELWQHQTGGFV